MINDKGLLIIFRVCKTKFSHPTDGEILNPKL